MVENLEDPDLNKPNNISKTDRKDYLKMFCWKKEIRRWINRKEDLQADKKIVYPSVGSIHKNHTE